MPNPLIELRNLSKSYQEGNRQRMILCDANLTIERGELAVLVGRSGTGKSTLLNLLSGIDPPNAGEVVIDGVTISALSERERTLFRRDKIGFVFQFFNLIPTLTVEENILLPIELKGRVGPEQHRAALALLEEVGLADRAASFPDRLSGGEQQRVAVARALAHDPLLVLADEPTGNLDLETGLQVLDLLDRLTRRAGKTMVMVTHSPEVVGIADRVFRVEDCRLVEERLSLLVRSSLRYLFRRPWQFGLAVVGVALGVAVVVSIGLANASASRAFTLSTEAITGRATHQVVGGPRGLPDDAFRRLTVEAGLERAAPVVDDWVAVPLAGPVSPATGRRRGRAFHLLGVDPFSEGPFRSYLGAPGGAPRGGGDGTAGSLGALLTRPGTVVMAAEAAAELGLRPGDAFTVRAAGVPRRLELAGTLAPKDADARRAVSDLLLTDIASAQETLGRIGRLDRIDLLLSPGEAGKRELARAAAVLASGAPGAQILPAAGRTRSTEEMTRSFRLNLTALSLLALVCGVFLIYNTMTFSVVQRRTWIGTLRALGVSRREIFALVLGEAAVVAVLGTALGLGAGVLLGRGLVRLVTQTINDLYFVVSVRELAVSPAILLLGALLGIGATLLAALVPALEATQAPPRAVLLRSTLEGRLRRSLPRATALGFALLALGGLLLVLPGGLALSFAGLFALILGFALLAPVATVLLMRLLRRPLGAMLGVLGRMAAGGVVASLSRTAVAIAALVIAVSVTVGIGVMIDSFRQTVVRWLAMTLQSDVFVAVPSRAGGFAGVDLDPEVARQAMALPGVAGGHTVRRVELPSPKGPVRLVVMGATTATLATTFELKEGDRARAWPAFQTGDALLVSEPYASRTGVGRGATVRLPTEQGERAFRVMGVYYDYASDQGVLLMSRATYLRHWSDRALSGFALDLAPGADPDRVAAQLRATLGGERGLSVQSNRALKKISLEIFDRTFLITSVLRLLAALVAFIGVLASLMALQLERGRELGVLRANGMTPGQVWQLVTAQTGLMGLAAGLLSLPVGLSLAAVMIYVVNRRSFGWTIRMELAPQVLLQAFLLALAAALLAGLYPAYKMARTSPALALREE